MTQPRGRSGQWSQKQVHIHSRWSVARTCAGIPAEIVTSSRSSCPETRNVACQTAWKRREGQIEEDGRVKNTVAAATSFSVTGIGHTSVSIKSFYPPRASFSSSHRMAWNLFHSVRTKHVRAVRCVGSSVSAGATRASHFFLVLKWLKACVLGVLYQTVGKNMESSRWAGRAAGVRKKILSKTQNTGRYILSQKLHTRIIAEI